MSFHPTTVTIGDTVYIPVPEGMTYADAEAALADAGAWVEVEPVEDIPRGARIRMEWRYLESRSRHYIHRDDLPPADPDAELVEAIAEAILRSKDTPHDWARAALAVVREHEAKS